MHISKEVQRPRRGVKRERTRRALIDCAAALVAERGFEGTSLEEVARRAGMTRGAIYGNFESREELFLAVAETQWEPLAPPPKPGATLSEQLETLAEMVIAALPDRRRKAVGAASFVTYALRNESLREKVLAANKGAYEAGAARILSEIPERELPMPAESLVRVCHALIEGFLALNALTPELIDESTIRAAFRALAV
jgi:AcrR family transcriptional regulator